MRFYFVGVIGISESEIGMMSLMLRSSVTTTDIFVGNNLFNSKYNFSSSEMNPATTALSKMINTCFAAASSSAFERFLNLLEMWEPMLFFMPPPFR